MEEKEKNIFKKLLCFSISGLPHDGVARLIAECFAKRNRPHLTLVVQDQIRTPAEMRRSCMLPQ